MAKKIRLIKKGAPLPGKPEFKFVSSHLKKTEAVKVERNLLSSPRTDDTILLKIPKQHAVYRKPIRITPKRPKLRR